MPPKPRPGSVTTTRPRVTAVGTPDVVAPSTSAASRDYSESIARAIGVPQIADDLALTRGIWADASKGIDLSGMDAATKKEAVLGEIRKRGPQYWAPWITNFKKSQPQSAAPAAVAPQAAPAADPLDAPVVEDDAPSATPSAKPAAQGRAPANQAPSGPSKAMRAWLVRYGDVPQAEVDAMSDNQVAVAKAKIQKTSSGRPAPADANPPEAQTGKRSRGRPKGSGAKPPQGESNVRRPKQTGSVVETGGEGVVNTVGDTPASTADLESLSPEKLEELLLKARVRQATRGSQIDVGRGSVGELPNMDAPPAGLGIGADEFVVNRLGGSETTANPGEGARSGFERNPDGTPAPPRQPPAGGGGGGGQPNPQNDPLVGPEEPEKPGWFPTPYNPFGTTKVEQGGKTVYKDNWGRSALKYFGVPAALAGGGVAAYRMAYPPGGSAMPADEREAIRQRAIMARQFKHQLFGPYDEPTTPAPMAPSDMPAPPENNIRAFQRGVR